MRRMRRGVKELGDMWLHFCCLRSSTIVEAEGCRVICKEVDKAVDDGVAWPCRGVMEVVLHDDIVMTWQNG